MIVSDITQAGTILLAAAEFQPQDGPVDETVQVVPQGEDVTAPEPIGDQVAGDVVDVVTEDADDGTAGEGMLRRLMAGHFKGVADVRLRLNFHDEIVAAQTEATRSAAGDVVTDLSETVSAQLGELASAAELSVEQVAALAEHEATFTEAVSGAAEAFMGAEDPAAAGEALTGSVAEAFSSLSASLGVLVAPAAVEPSDQTPPAVPDPQEATVGEQPLAALEEAFAASLLDLTAALTNAPALGELSPAKGNGVAYDKFLAEYSALVAPPASDDAPELPQPVDVEV